jgi:hypothetical protein
MIRTTSIHESFNRKAPVGVHLLIVLETRSVPIRLNFHEAVFVCHM